MAILRRGHSERDEIRRHGSHYPESASLDGSHTVGDVAAATVPRAGMLATVRNRSGVVAAVKPFDGEKGRLHLVHVEYKDSRSPVEERLLWELEPGCTLCRRRRRTTWLG